MITTSPTGTPIDIRPIRTGQLGEVLVRCLPDGTFSVWVGGLPWTTYQKLGFIDETPHIGDDLPERAEGNAPPEVVEVVRAGLAAGRPRPEFHSRLMVLKLDDA